MNEKTKNRDDIFDRMEDCLDNKLTQGNRTQACIPIMRSERRRPSLSVMKVIIVAWIGLEVLSSLGRLEYNTCKTLEETLLPTPANRRFHETIVCKPLFWIGTYTVNFAKLVFGSSFCYADQYSHINPRSYKMYGQKKIYGPSTLNVIDQDKRLVAVERNIPISRTALGRRKTRKAQNASMGIIPEMDVYVSNLIGKKDVINCLCWLCDNDEQKTDIHEKAMHALKNDMVNVLQMLVINAWIPPNQTRSIRPPLATIRPKWIDVKLLSSRRRLNRSGLVSRFGEPDKIEEGKFDRAFQDRPDVIWLIYDYVAFAIEKLEREKRRRSSAIGLRIYCQEYLDAHIIDWAISNAHNMKKPETMESHGEKACLNTGAKNLLRIHSVTYSPFGPRLPGEIIQFDPTSDAQELSKENFLYVSIHVIRAPGHKERPYLKIVDNQGNQVGKLYAWTDKTIFRRSRKIQSDSGIVAQLKKLASGEFFEDDYDMLLIFKGDYDISAEYSLVGCYVCQALPYQGLRPQPTTSKAKSIDTQSKTEAQSTKRSGR
jgi:hypothetical protein